MRRTGLAALLALLALLATVPVARRLRRARPPAPKASRLGVGRLLGGVLTGAFRPLLVNYLWIRADILQGQGRLDELQVLYRTMVALYPNNSRAREFLGWNLAFNFKNETPDNDVAWAWTREGLAILLETRRTAIDFTDPLVDWFLKQCGQDPLPPFHLLRYAGPAWEREKILRAHVRDWAQPHFGRTMERFDLGLRFNAGDEQFSGKVTRALLLERKVIDDWVRKGSSDAVDAAVAALRWVAGTQGLGDLDPGVGRYFEDQASMLEQLGRGEVTRATVETGGYEAAISLFALGAHGRNPALLHFAQEALGHFADKDEDEPCREEHHMLQRWIDFADAGFAGERPRLPFDP